MEIRIAAKYAPAWALALAALWLAGCQTPARVKVWVEALEQELREKEDYIFELEEENERLCRQLERNEDRPPASSRQVAPTPAPRETGAGIEPGRAESPRALSPRIESPRIDSPREIPRSSLVPPSVELEPPRTPEPLPGEGDAAPDLSPRRVPPENSPLEPPAARLAPPAEVQPLELSPGRATPAPAELPAPETLPVPGARSLGSPPGEPEEIDPRVSWLEIDPVRTQGFGAENLSGDKGLTVVLVPRNEAGQFLPRAEAVSIVALDPSQEGDAMRLGRWNFVASEVAQALENGPVTGGIPLQLPWQGAAPANSEVRLFVRYLASPREFVEAEHTVQVVLPGQVSSRWTPAARGHSAVERASVESDSEAIAPANEEEPMTAATSSLAAALAQLKRAAAGTGAHEAPTEPATSPGDILVPPSKDRSRRPLWRPYR